MASLLGQFYSRIKGSQEDIASEGLTYILQRSIRAKTALNRLILTDCGLKLGDINYVTQNIGKKLERPDISGFDENGKEVIIIEAKFWASLTDNQPVEYLHRLKENSILIFICPTLRVRPVHSEIKKRLFEAGISSSLNNTNYSFEVEKNKFLIVKTWNEVLSTIRTQLVQDNEQNLLSDIDQIIGLCESIDNNSFQPFRSEDFSPAIAKRINSYNDIIDKVTDELKIRVLADTSKLKATPQRSGYTRYIRIGDFGLSLNVNYDLWERIADTPFWLNIKDDTTNYGWLQTETFKLKIKKLVSGNSIVIYEGYNKDIFIPIFPLIELTEDQVVSNFTDQIVDLIEKLKAN